MRESVVLRKTRLRRQGRTSGVELAIPFGSSLLVLRLTAKKRRYPSDSCCLSLDRHDSPLFAVQALVLAASDDGLALGVDVESSDPPEILRHVVLAVLLRVALNDLLLRLGFPLLLRRLLRLDLGARQRLRLDRVAERSGLLRVPSRGDSDGLEGLVVGRERGPGGRVGAGAGAGLGLLLGFLLRVILVVGSALLLPGV